ncbi:hypothetical protein BFG51_05480 [Dietzia alimentaria]|nr:hypothetical protein BFG51_05480 [Dietzia alimentaria]
MLPQPERAAGPLGPALGAGGVLLEVGAGRDDVGMRGVGVVVVDEFAQFVGGIGDEPVGGVHDLLFTDPPGLGLGGVPLGEDRVLHRRQGVRGVHQWHPPVLGRDEPGLAREPVVGVDEVVVARRLPGLRPHHAGDERAQLRGQVLLAQALERSGHDVADQHAVARPARPTAATSGWRGVKISTSTPRRARRRAVCRT